MEDLDKNNSGKTGEQSSEKTIPDTKPVSGIPSEKKPSEKTIPDTKPASEKPDEKKLSEKKVSDSKPASEKPLEKKLSGVKASQNESSSKLREEMEPYFDAHPGIDAFYLATDGQPFYEKQWAKEHQKTLDPTKDITTVTR